MFHNPGGHWNPGTGPHPNNIIIDRASKGIQEFEVTRVLDFAPFSPEQVSVQHGLALFPPTLWKVGGDVSLHVPSC